MPKISGRMLYRLIWNFTKVLNRALSLDTDKKWVSIYNDMTVANELILAAFTKEERRDYDPTNG